MNDSNVTNRTIFGRDNIDILEGINSDCIDLIYLDPPFNKKRVFTAPIGSSAEGARFKDIFRQEDLKDEWVQTIKEEHFSIYELLNAVKNIEGRTSYNYCYLAYMAIRLMGCHRILKNTGSIYLHCDPTMSHYLKIVMDTLFGYTNFRNEIVWAYRKWTNVTRDFQKNHDIILRYSKTNTFTFNELYNEDTPQSKKHLKGWDTNKIKGISQLIVYNVSKAQHKIDNGNYDRIVYKDQQRGVFMQDWWEISILNSQSKERVGYPTQKPLALLERIIKASSNKGDIVLDPFCGCATTCVAAEELHRRWIGIDVSVKSYELVKQRLAKEVENADTLFYENLVHYTQNPPKRTDKDNTSAEKKHVYIMSHPNYSGEYKVGIAGNVKSRLNAYQTSDPNRSYKLEYSLHTEHYREIEGCIHDKFENKHEWTRAKLNDIITAIESYRPRVHICTCSLLTQLLY